MGRFHFFSFLHSNRDERFQSFTFRFVCLRRLFFRFHLDVVFSTGLLPHIPSVWVALLGVRRRGHDAALLLSPPHENVRTCPWGEGKVPNRHRWGTVKHLVKRGWGWWWWRRRRQERGRTGRGGGGGGSRDGRRGKKGSGGGWGRKWPTRWTRRGGGLERVKRCGEGGRRRRRGEQWKGDGSSRGGGGQGGILSSSSSSSSADKNGGAGKQDGDGGRRGRRRRNHRIARH